MPVNGGAGTALRAHGVAVTKGAGTPSGVGTRPRAVGAAGSEGVGTAELERVPVGRGHRAWDAFRGRGDTENGTPGAWGPCPGVWGRWEGDTSTRDASSGPPTGATWGLRWVPAV